MLIGYARVSTSEQETDLQFDALRRAGVKKIYHEKVSGVSSRPQLRLLLKQLQPGHQLYVYKLDRLARSLQDLLAILETLKNAKCGFRSLTEPIDTASPAGLLMLHMLGAVAQFERSLIRERCMAGQASAMSRGVHCGRPRSLHLDIEADINKLWASGFYTLKTLAIIFDAHESTIKRAVYRINKPNSSSLL